MYSPKISERLIPRLYRLGRKRRQPVTRLVNEAVAEYLAKHEGDAANAAPEGRES